MNTEEEQKVQQFKHNLYNNFIQTGIVDNLKVLFIYKHSILKASLR